LLINVCPFVLFLLAIVLSIFLQFTASDCPVDILKLLLRHVRINKCSIQSHTKSEQATNAKHEDETPHQKTASETKDNGGNAKMDEVLEQVGLMMKKMINIETLIKNPLAKLDI
jgi:hypothetical protein